MGYAIGIDLGTTNSVAAVWRDGQTEVIPLREGNQLLPSAISLRPDGTLLVGQAARRRANVEPGESVQSSKRLIGDPDAFYQLRDKRYTPVDVAAIILSRLREEASAYLKQDVRHAVITVPAYFTTVQKRATRVAAESAGLTVLALLPEPSAAALAFGLQQQRKQTLLVYDLGGGTFDVSLLRVDNNRFAVQAVDGDGQLGGDDFDRLLARELLQRAVRQPGAVDIIAMVKYTDNLLSPQPTVRAEAWQAARNGTIPSLSRQAVQQLTQAAETCKKTLSEADTADVVVPQLFGKVDLETTVTLAQFNGLIAPLVEQTLAKVTAVLRASKVDAEELGAVVLVGGSTRNRLVRAKVREALREPWQARDVDFAVAEGAAVEAARLFSLPDMRGPLPTSFRDDLPEPRQADTLPIGIERVEVTPHSLGIRSIVGGEQGQFVPLIPRNTPLPHTAKDDRFSTVENNQTQVRIAVFQGESSLAKNNTFVGGFLLEGIPPSPAEQPRIAVEFRMDNNDELHVEAHVENVVGVSRTQTLDVRLVSVETEVETPAVQPVDIMFLVDTSGSMSGELAGVKKLCAEFAHEVQKSGVPCRIGVMDFALPSGIKYNFETFGPMEPSILPAAIEKLSIGRIGGGGCYIGSPPTIPVIEAFIDTFDDPTRLKIGILLSDEVGNDPEAIKKIETVLNDACIRLFVVGVKNSCHVRLAEATGAQFWDITQIRTVDLSVALTGIATRITDLARR